MTEIVYRYRTSDEGEGDLAKYDEGGEEESVAKRGITKQVTTRQLCEED